MIDCVSKRLSVNLKPFMQRNQICVRKCVAFERLARMERKKFC